MPANPDPSAAIPVIARRLPAAAAIQKQALRLRLLDCFGRKPFAMTPEGQNLRRPV